MTTPSPAPRPAEEPHGIRVPAPHHAVNYVRIFLLLVALTAVTVLVAFKRFDREWVNVLAALLVATTKAAFVATYFMHLKFEGKLIYLILFVPVGLAIVLICALMPDIGAGIYHLAHTPDALRHDAGLGAAH